MPLPTFVHCPVERYLLETLIDEILLDGYAVRVHADDGPGMPATRNREAILNALGFAPITEVFVHRPNWPWSVGRIILAHGEGFYTIHDTNLSGPVSDIVDRTLRRTEDHFSDWNAC